MFDTTLDFKIKLPSPSGLVEVTVKFPTDDQWLEYHRGRRVIERDLGRGKTEPAVLGAEAAAERLFAQIKVDGDLDRSQADLLIRRLADARVASVEDEGGQYRVTVRFLNMTGVHVLKMPSALQMKQAEAATRVVNEKYGAVEIMVNLKVFADLYGEMLVSAEGYSSSAPLLHKHAVVQAVLSEVREAMSGGEDFF